MSGGASEAIRRAIAAHGPIPFAEFMDLALYGPGGFYEEPPVGERGHFVTSPHVHPVFGELVARAIRGMWSAMGCPAPLRIVELGAGDGTLARLVSEALGEVPLDYTAVERSTGARRALARLPVRVVPSLEVLDQSLTGAVVLGNEILDNMPFHWIRAHVNGYTEIHVTFDDGRFVPVEIPCRAELIRELNALSLRPGQEAAVSLQALHLLERMARMLRTGYALLIDYASGDGPLSVRGYRRHRKVEDVLEEPGTADITAGVDFGAIAGHLRDLGLVTAGPITQRAALASLGYRDWERDARDRQGEHLGQARGREAVRTWSERNAARTLVDPDGLGDLRWLAARTSDLPWPPWLSPSEADGRPSEESP